MVTPSPQPRMGFPHLQVNVLQTALMKMDAGWGNRTFLNGFWRIYVNDRHGAGAERAGKTLWFAPDRLYVIPAWMRWETRFRRPLSHYYIHFDLVGLHQSLLEQLFDQVYQFEPSGAWEGCIRQWQQHLRETGDDRLRLLCDAQSVVHQLIPPLLAQLSDAQRLACTGFLAERTPVTPAVDYIQSHLDETLTNAQLARVCHMSRDHFIRTFRKIMQRTPAQFVIDARVKAASERLAFTRESVDAIAEAFGFADRFHFSRVFKSRMGKTPVAYRRHGWS